MTSPLVVLDILPNLGCPVNKAFYVRFFEFSKSSPNSSDLLYADSEYFHTEVFSSLFGCHSDAARKLSNATSCVSASFGACKQIRSCKQSRRSTCLMILLVCKTIASVVYKLWSYYIG